MTNRNLKGNAFRKQERFGLAGLACFVMVAGCTFRPPVRPDLAKRLGSIKTVAVSPPYFECYSEREASSSHALMAPIPASATNNVAKAVQEEFARLEPFTLQDLDLWNSSLAPMTPPWMRSGRVATPLNPNPPRATGAPLLVGREGMNFRPHFFQSPSSEPAADAALFIFGWQKTREISAYIEQLLLGPEILPLDLIEDMCMPGNPQKWLLCATMRREVCIALCLIDCRTGEILWSDVEVGYGLLNIEDPNTAKRLVAKARRKFAQAERRSSNQGVR